MSHHWKWDDFSVTSHQQHVLWVSQAVSRRPVGPGDRFITEHSLNISLGPYKEKIWRFWPEDHDIWWLCSVASDHLEGLRTCFKHVGTQLRQIRPMVFNGKSEEPRTESMNMWRLICPSVHGDSCSGPVSLFTPSIDTFNNRDISGVENPFLKHPHKYWPRNDTDQTSQTSCV